MSNSATPRRRHRRNVARRHAKARVHHVTDSNAPNQAQRFLEAIFSFGRIMQQKHRVAKQLAAARITLSGADGRRENLPPTHRLPSTPPVTGGRLIRHAPRGR
jgi:hypothetical protein